MRREVNESRWRRAGGGIACFWSERSWSERTSGTCLLRGHRWATGQRGALLLLCLCGLAMGQEEPDTLSEPPEPTGVPDLGIVTEEELAPALDSNRQPLGPDPLEWPQWSAAEVEAIAAGRPVNLGGGLWSPERFPLQPVPSLPDPVQVGQPAAALPASDAVLGAEAMDRYRVERVWCVDPQRCLPDGRRARMEAHLAAHAATARHPVRVWWLGPGQSLAPEVDAERLREESFGPMAPGVLAILPVDHPERGRWVGPGGLGGSFASPSDPPRVRETESTGLEAPSGQLEAWVVRLTLDAYRLPDPGAAVATARAVERAAPARGPAPLHLPAAVWVSLGLAVLGIGIALAIRRRPRIVSSQPCLWLEIDRPPRLGGAHSGGAGASLEW